MSVCAKNRKALALLAIGALNEEEAQDLGAHAQTCAGCRRYLAEIEQVTTHMQVAKAPEETEPPLRLRARTLRALREEKGPPPNPVWRLLVPALAAILFFLVILPRTKTESPGLAPAPSQDSAMTEPQKNDTDPTLLNYDTAVNQSPEILDRLLQEQARRALAAAPVYRAGSFGLE